MLLVSLLPLDLLLPLLKTAVSVQFGANAATEIPFAAADAAVAFGSAAVV